MKKALKMRYEEASRLPNEPIFTTKDIMEIFHFSSQATAQRFDKSGLVRTKTDTDFIHTTRLNI